MDQQSGQHLAALPLPGPSTHRLPRAWAVRGGLANLESQQRSGDAAWSPPTRHSVASGGTARSDDGEGVSGPSQAPLVVCHRHGNEGCPVSRGQRPCLLQGAPAAGAGGLCPAPTFLLLCRWGRAVGGAALPPTGHVAALHLESLAVRQDPPGDHTCRQGRLCRVRRSSVTPSHPSPASQEVWPSVTCPSQVRTPRLVPGEQGRSSGVFRAWPSPSRHNLGHVTLLPSPLHRREVTLPRPQGPQG